MNTIPSQYRRVIRDLIEADPEVAQATCDIPHLAPQIYLKEGGPDDDNFPYCGCFIGVYAWMAECKLGRTIDTDDNIPTLAAKRTRTSAFAVSSFAEWCDTPTRDRQAVVYARELLEKLAN